MPKPQEYLNNGTVIERVSLYNYDNLPELDPNFTYSIEVHGDREDGYDIELIKTSYNKILNPNYENELKAHKDSLKKQKEWKEWKKIWDEEQIELGIKKEKELYQKLKEKYEK